MSALPATFPPTYLTPKLATTLKTYDRGQFVDDMIAGLNSRIATRQTFYTTIDNDEQAIITAAGSDPHASAKLQADVKKWISDKTTNMATLLGDLQKLVADRTQLVADLNASVSSA